MNTELLGQKKPDSTYGEYDDKLIKLLTLQKTDSAHNLSSVANFEPFTAAPFGSYTLRAQKYPGDIDLHEPYVVDAQNVGVAAEKLAHRLQEEIRNILNSSTQISPKVISDIKAGLDELFVTAYSKYANVSLSDTRLQTEKEYIRNKMVIRWTPTEILDGKKIWNGRNITLKKALQSRGHIKYDVITIGSVGTQANSFIEVTNFIFFGYIDPVGQFHVINTEYDFTNAGETFVLYTTQLKNEIDKLLYSKLFYNPFKAAKRMYALYRAMNNVTGMARLYPLISGDVSQLYQIKSSLSAMILFFETIDKNRNLYSSVKTSPIGSNTGKIVYSVLDNVKSNLSTNLLIRTEVLVMINTVIASIQEAITDKTFDTLISPGIQYLLKEAPKEVSKITDILSEIINKNTELYL